MALDYDFRCSDLSRHAGASARPRSLETGEQRLERFDAELGLQTWFSPRLPAPLPNRLCGGRAQALPNDFHYLVHRPAHRAKLLSPPGLKVGVAARMLYTAVATPQEGLSRPASMDSGACRLPTRAARSRSQRRSQTHDHEGVVSKLVQ
jgi:hypothetical protein